MDEIPELKQRPDVECTIQIFNKDTFNRCLFRKNQLFNRVLSGTIAWSYRGAIAQLARAPALQAGGPGFESPLLHQIRAFSSAG